IYYFSAGGLHHKQWVEVAALYFLGMIGHFGLGNSNTLATIDVAGAFMGLSSHSALLSSILMFSITYANKENDEVYTQVTFFPEPELGERNVEDTGHEDEMGEEEGGGVSPRMLTPHMLCVPILQDYTQERPSQELVAKDLYEVEWKFQHFYRGSIAILHRTVQENPEPQSNQHSNDRQEGPQVADGYKEEAPRHIKPMSNMKIPHLMELPPVGLSCGLSGYGSKEIYYTAPLMNLWMKYSQLQPPHDSPSVIRSLLLTARLNSPPRPSSSFAPPLRPVFDQELPDFVSDCTRVLASFILSSSMLTYLSASCIMYMDMKPAEEFHTGVGSQPKPVSVEKQVSMEKRMAKPNKFEFPVTEATMVVTPGNSGTFGGNKRSIPSSGSGNGFLPVELEVQRASGRTHSDPTSTCRSFRGQSLTLSEFLATHDLVKVQQRVAYEDILISKEPKM
ncbi:hypothetical protein GIB67_015344, partial [Kingdonia uniflora]